MMRPKTTMNYLPGMSQVTDDFIQHIRKIRNAENDEMPGDFQNELYKWALECKYSTRELQN